MLKTSPEWAALVKRVHPELYRIGKVRGLFLPPNKRPAPHRSVPDFADLFEPCAGARLTREEIVSAVQDRFGSDLTGRAIIPQFRKMAGFPREFDSAARGFHDWKLKN